MLQYSDINLNMAKPFPFIVIKSFIKITIIIIKNFAIIFF